MGRMLLGTDSPAGPLDARGVPVSGLRLRHPGGAHGEATPRAA
jgi:hypothetical protein